MVNLQNNLDKLTSILDSTLNDRQWAPPGNKFVTKIKNLVFP